MNRAIIIALLTLTLSGCVMPHADFADGQLNATHGVVATWTATGDTETYTIDTTAHNWWSATKDFTARMLDRVSGMVGRTSAEIGD